MDSEPSGERGPGPGPAPAPGPGPGPAQHVPEQPAGRGEGIAAHQRVRAPEHDGQQRCGARPQAVAHHHQPVLLQDSTEGGWLGGENDKGKRIDDNERKEK